MSGKDLKSRMQGMDPKELFDVVNGLISVGFVSSNRDMAKPEDMDRSNMFVNPGYAKDLKEAIDPPEKESHKRVRRT